MELGFIGKVRLKMNEWFSEPIGAPQVPDSTGTELKKPFETFETPRFQPNRKGGRGRGDKREVPHKIEEFYARGPAGRHEGHGPKGPRKAVMAYKGNRQKYPK
jgi:hypothetical protein